MAAVLGVRLFLKISGVKTRPAIFLIGRSIYGVIISWNTTQACNIKCLHCYRNAGEMRSDELDTEQGKKLLSEIAAAGFKIIILSGGEPLLRKDIFVLIEYAASIGLRPVIGTNGIKLDYAAAVRLKSAGLKVASISLDSKNKVAHNLFRQSSGAWDKTISGIEACKSAGLPFQIHTTIMDWNKSEILGITDLAVELGAIAHHIFFWCQPDGLRRLPINH